MSVRFPPLNDNGNPKQYVSSIVTLTSYDKKDISKQFCKALNGYCIRAIDFDTVKLDWCECRNSFADYGKKQKCKSVDAFVDHNGTYYFIEFKYSFAEKLDLIDDDGDNIDSLLRKKAIDSLSLVGMTILQGVSGKNVMDNAELIVVYRPSFNDNVDSMTPGIKKASDKLHSFAKAKDSTYSNLDVKWKLADLKKRGFFRDVHTWNEDVFVEWAKRNLV